MSNNAAVQDSIASKLLSLSFNESMLNNFIEGASRIKAQAADHYKHRFEEAAELYSTILLQNSLDTSGSLVRVVRCNRTACLVELGQCALLPSFIERMCDTPSIGKFSAAVQELNEVLLSRYPDESAGSKVPLVEREREPIFHKAHFRMARCLFELEKCEMALQELSTYTKPVKGRVDAAEPRTKIIVSAVSNGPPSRRTVGQPGSDITATNSPTTTRRMFLPVRALTKE